MRDDSGRDDRGRVHARDIRTDPDAVPAAPRRPGDCFERPVHGEPGDGSEAMTQSYVIEVGDESAGLVVAERGGYRFFASRDRFARLEGRVFATPQAAERAANDEARRKKAVARG